MGKKRKLSDDTDSPQTVKKAWTTAPSFRARYNPGRESTKADLVRAIKSNDISKVRELLSVINVNSLLNKNNDTALLIAARHNQSAIVHLLLAGCADPNVQDKQGNSALHWAAFLGNENIAKHLIEIPATNLFLQNKAGNAPIHIAYKRDHSNIVMHCKNYQALKEAYHLRVITAKLRSLKFQFETQLQAQKENCKRKRPDNLLLGGEPSHKKSKHEEGEFKRKRISGDEGPPRKRRAIH